MRARSADVFTDPMIQPNYLSDAMDRRVTLGGIRLIRRLLATPQLAPFVESEELPGNAVQSDDELLGFAYANGSTTYHLIGTARMGPQTDPMAVVDDQLRVHGLRGLRVVDASHHAEHAVGQHIRHDVWRIAAKAADMIRGRAAPEMAEAGVIGSFPRSTRVGGVEANGGAGRSMWRPCPPCKRMVSLLRRCGEGTGMAYRGAIRIAPSRRMVSPFSMGLLTIASTICAYSAGRPRRAGNGTC